MEILKRIIIGLAISGGGILVLLKAENLVYLIGESSWAEWNMANMGGTRGLIKIFALIIIFIGFAITVNLGNDIASGIARMIIPGA